MQGASFETFHRALRTIVELKRKYGATKPAIRINYTVNPENLAELGNFFDQYSDYDITTLQVRPMFNAGDTTYRHRDLVAHDEEYNGIIDLLIGECRRRGISLLANKHDPGYQRNNKFAVVYDKAVFRYIGPDAVWRDGFDFRSETYRDYVRRIGYRRELLNYVLQGDASLLNNSVRASSQLF